MLYSGKNGNNLLIRLWVIYEIVTMGVKKVIRYTLLVGEKYYGLVKMWKKLCTQNIFILPFGRRSFASFAHSSTITTYYINKEKNKSLFIVLMVCYLKINSIINIRKWVQRKGDVWR